MCDHLTSQWSGTCSERFTSFSLDESFPRRLWRTSRGSCPRWSSQCTWRSTPCQDTTSPCWSPLASILRNIYFKENQEQKMTPRISIGEMKRFQSKVKFLKFLYSVYLCMKWNDELLFHSIYFQTFSHKASSTFWTCFTMETFAISIKRASGRKRIFPSLQISSWRQGPTFRPTKWAWALRSWLTVTQFSGLMSFWNWMENTLLILSWRIQQGMLLFMIYEIILFFIIFFSFTKRRIFNSQSHKGDSIHIEKNDYSLMIDYFVSLRS